MRPAMGDLEPVIVPVRSHLVSPRPFISFARASAFCFGVAFAGTLTFTLAIFRSQSLFGLKSIAQLTSHPRPICLFSDNRTDHPRSAFHVGMDDKTVADQVTMLRLNGVTAGPLKGVLRESWG